MDKRQTSKLGQENAHQTPCERGCQSKPPSSRIVAMFEVSLRAISVDCESARIFIIGVCS